MFNLLKNKFSSFVARVKSASEEKEEKREIKPTVGIKRKVEAQLKGYITLGESELDDMLFELELALLEADVDQQTATAICKEIKKRMLHIKIERDVDIEAETRKLIKSVLYELLKTEKVPKLVELVRTHKPLKVLVLGPNGAGKSTTMAKLTYMLQQNGLKCIWAASDTFRAASIEQLEEHARRLNIRLVKHGYGADPAAVAFDAVRAAAANKADVVLIDTAGRQDTNTNLLEELRKVVRVVKPELKLYVVEAFAGKNTMYQAKKFDATIGIDALIVTKLDVDTKGGSVLSLLYNLKKPIMFVGVGQNYQDLQEFSLDFILDRIL
jgi:fused signal recognition particle receptor